jgi:hypothetical protein
LRQVLIFCVFLLWIAALGAAAHLFPRSVGRALHRRVTLLVDAWPPKWWWRWIAPPPWSLSVGGLLVAFSFGVMLVLFTCYWGAEHLFHSRYRHSMSATQIATRTVGQVANVVMGLMVLPVARNSVLTAGFGIAWEQVRAARRGCSARQFA